MKMMKDEDTKEEPKEDEKKQNTVDNRQSNPTTTTTTTTAQRPTEPPGILARVSQFVSETLTLNNLVSGTAFAAVAASPFWVPALGKKRRRKRSSSTTYA